MMRLWTGCCLVVITAMVPSIATAAALDVTYTDHAYVDVYVHARVPLQISVPEEIDRFDIGSPTYRMSQDLQSLRVLAPPQPVTALLAIELVTGQRLEVMLRGASSIDAAVSRVVFRPASGDVEETRKPAINVAPAKQSAPWSILTGFGAGQLRVNNDNVRTNSVMATVFACGAKTMAHNIYWGVCVDQMLPRRPATEPAECEADYCWALRERNATATSVETVLGVAFGSRWVVDAQLQAGVVVHYAFSGSLLEYEIDGARPFRARTEGDDYIDLSPVVGTNVSAGYCIAPGWRVGIGADVGVNIPMAGLSIRASSLYAGVAADIF